MSMGQGERVFVSVILHFQWKIIVDIMGYGFHLLFNTLKYICITLTNSLVPIFPIESEAIIALANQIVLREPVHNLCKTLPRFHMDNLENVVVLTCIFSFLLIQMSLLNIA